MVLVRCNSQNGYIFSLKGYRRVVSEAHKHNIQVIGATLLPFSGALPNTPLDNYYQPNKDQLRQRINHWMRTSHTFDGVLDLDEGLKDPKHPNRLNPIYDSGDHLHPMIAAISIWQNW